MREYIAKEGKQETREDSLRRRRRGQEEDACILRMLFLKSINFLRRLSEDVTIEGVIHQSIRWVIIPQIQWVISLTLIENLAESKSAVSTVVRLLLHI